MTTAYRCLYCGSTFQLHGSAPRLRVVEWLLTWTTTEVGTVRSVTFDPPEAFSHQAVCPDCSRDHAAAIRVLEQNAAIKEQTQ